MGTVGSSTNQPSFEPNQFGFPQVLRDDLADLIRAAQRGEDTSEIMKKLNQHIAAQHSLSALDWDRIRTVKIDVQEIVDKLQLLNKGDISPEEFNEVCNRAWAHLR